MADKFVHLRPGDHIQARTINSMIDVTKLQRGQSAINAKIGMQHQGNQYHNGIVRIKNTSGSDVGRFDILGIDDILYAQSDDAATFYNEHPLEGTTPTTADHQGRFAIVLEPITNGSIGMGLISGVTVCQININSATDEWADVKNSDATMLDSGTFGSAHILYKESGTGTKWAVVRLGNPVESSTMLKAKATQNWSYPDGGDNTDDTTGEFRIKANPWDVAADDWDTETTITIYIPVATTQNGTGAEFAIGHPNVLEDQVIYYTTNAYGDNIADGGTYVDDPIGTIRIWVRKDASDDPDHLPPGWQLADGTNNTVDLRGRFVVGYYSSSGLSSDTRGDDADYDAIGDTATAYNHTHTTHDNWTHNHMISDFSEVQSGTGIYVVSGCITDCTTDSRDLSHNTVDHRPPYYVVAYLQRLDNSVAWTT